MSGLEGVESELVVSDVFDTEVGSMFNICSCKQTFVQVAETVLLFFYLMHFSLKTNP